MKLEWHHEGTNSVTEHGSTTRNSSEEKNIWWNLSDNMKEQIHLLNMVAKDQCDLNLDDEMLEYFDGYNYLDPKAR